MDLQRIAAPDTGKTAADARLRLLRRAAELGSISAACAEAGFSRDSYYRFKRAYEKGGIRALREMVRTRPRPKNRVAPAIEDAVLATAADHPDWGAGRIAGELARRLGLSVSRSGVRGVLARRRGPLAPFSASAAPGTAGRPRARATRSEMAALILGSAFELFAQKNYSTVTVKNIADAIAINPSLVHYYFGSKEGLFLQVVEKAAADAHATFQEIRHDETHPARVIELWIRNHVAQFPLMQNLIKISVDYANTHGDDEKIGGAIRKFYRIEAAILRDALQRGIDQGIFRPLDIDRVSVFISTFLDGVLVRSVMFPEFSHRQAIDDLVGFVMEHLTADGGTPAPGLPCGG